MYSLCLMQLLTSLSRTISKTAVCFNQVIHGREEKYEKMGRGGMGCLKEKLKLLLFFKAVGMYSNSITLLSLVNALKMYHFGELFWYL